MSHLKLSKKGQVVRM